MARACSPAGARAGDVLAGAPARRWRRRRPASASSPASISPVGPPPAITTAWPVLAAPVVFGRAREPLIDNNALISSPRRLWLRPAVLRDEAGLEASPLRATY